MKFESDGGTAESWLLSSAEIEAVSDEHAAPNDRSGYVFWSTLLARCTVVFVGCSIDGGYISRMLRATKTEGRPQHFAIMANVTPQARRRYQVELGVAVLGYSFREEKGHPAGALLAYLERLRDASRPASTGTHRYVDTSTCEEPVPPEPEPEPKRRRTSSEVLFSGGCGAASASCSAATPAVSGRPRGVWSELSTTNAVDRKYHILSTGPDGALYSFGGLVSGGSGDERQSQPTAAVLRMHPSDGEWTVLADGAAPGAPSPRNEACGAIVGHSLYVFGGSVEAEQGGQGASCDELWRFDLTSREWERLDGLRNAPTPRCASGCAVNGTRLYVYGGGGVGLDQKVIPPLSDAYEFETVTRTWRALTIADGGLVPAGRSLPQIAVPDGPSSTARILSHFQAPCKTRMRHFCVLNYQRRLTRAPHCGSHCQKLRVFLTLHFLWRQAARCFSLAGSQSLVAG